MDRNTILAIVLMLVVIVFWPKFTDMLYPPTIEPEEFDYSFETPPPTEIPEQSDIPPATQQQQRQEQQQAFTPQLSLGSIQKTDNPEQTIRIETPLYSGLLTTKGGTIEEWYLKDFPDRNDPSAPSVNIIDNNDVGNLSLSFFSIEGFEIDLSDFDFVPESPVFTGESYTISAIDGQRTIVMTADLGENRFVRKRFTIYPDSYYIDLEVEFENLNATMRDRKYFLTWGSGIRRNEKHIQDDLQFSKTISYIGSDIEKFDVGGDPEDFFEEPFTVYWTATKSKYFCVLIVPPENPEPSRNIRIVGRAEQNEPDKGFKNYVTTLTVQNIPNSQVFGNSFLVYLGPLDRERFEEIQARFSKDLELKGLLDINSYIRPLSMVIYSVFNFLHGYIPNYGFVIIVFSFLINLLLFPLTAKSTRSMKKMSAVQPLLKELQEKYKKEPQKLQKAQVKLYKEKKINPLGGCIPMLLQMPMFFAIYPVFRAIELRGAPFILWINDLSQPDTVATLPFSIPMYGDQFNILTIVYAISLFIQQKIMMKDPKQKMMVYIMPLMLLLFLNRLSSGFILYFIVFNLLSIGQRFIVSDKDESEKNPVPKPVVSSPKKNQPKKRTKKGKKK
ncbi:membrane protein insertase YidC [candidate division KSB1 bacterium]|nr:membrane protein insertase YidC [candidate division KSB1 bacterium]